VLSAFELKVTRLLARQLEKVIHARAGQSPPRTPLIQRGQGELRLNSCGRAMGKVLMWCLIGAILREPGQGSLTLIERGWATAPTNTVLDLLDSFGV